MKLTESKVGSMRREARNDNTHARLEIKVGIDIINAISNTVVTVRDYFLKNPKAMSSIMPYCTTGMMGDTKILKVESPSENSHRIIAYGEFKTQSYKHKQEHFLFTCYLGSSDAFSVEFLEVSFKHNSNPDAVCTCPWSLHERGCTCGAIPPYKPKY